ncbi:hypothetical protein TNCV_669021 [Trichonephila clavipes]|nr:hypothetical protein TNCV_669021 [Trichonephila clavipes]
MPGISPTMPAVATIHEKKSISLSTGFCTHGLSWQSEKRNLGEISFVTSVGKRLVDIFQSMELRLLGLGNPVQQLSYSLELHDVYIKYLNRYPEE